MRQESRLPSRGLTEGDFVGPYQLIQQLGDGGFARVWQARQMEPLNRDVALKVLKPGMASAEALRQFQIELESLSQMNHPHVARVLDAGQTESGQPYLVMELVSDACTVTEWCEQRALDITHRLSLFLQLCAAVQHAHQQGVIHCDLKPNNVLVNTASGNAQVKVIDFGIARCVSEVSLPDNMLTLGTPAYMSPEQLANKDDVDTRSDVFALGTMLAELIGSEPPQDLHWIIHCCHEKDRTRRYASAAALADDVQRFMDAQPVTARAPSFAYHTGCFVKRHRVLVTAGLFACICLLLGFHSVQTSADTAKKRAQTAEQGSEKLITLWRRAAAGSGIPSSSAALREMLDRLSSPSFTAKVNDRCRAFITLSKTAQLQANTSLGLEAADQALALIRAHPNQIDPEQHIDCFTVLGQLRLEAGQIEQGHSFLREALQSALRWKGPESLEALQCRRRLGSALVDSHPAEAIQTLQTLRHQARSLNLPNTHSDLILARTDLITLLIHEGKLEEARVLLEKTLEHARHAGAATQNLAVRLLLKRALLMIKLKRDDAALAAYFDAVDEATQSNAIIRSPQ